MTVFTTPLIPSRHIPPLGVPDLTDWMNPVWWKFFDIAHNVTWKPSIDQLYHREGVDAKRRWPDQGRGTDRAVWKD